MCVSCSFKLCTCVHRSWVLGGGRYQNTYAVKGCYEGPDANSVGSGTKKERERESPVALLFIMDATWPQGVAAVWWNRITSSLPKFLQFGLFCFSAFFHTVQLGSIFTFILTFRKNKYQIHSYTTSNMEDLKTICIYENLRISVYFFKRREDFSCLLKKSNIFKYHSTCQICT